MSLLVWRLESLGIIYACSLVPRGSNRVFHQTDLVLNLCIAAIAHIGSSVV